MGLYTVSLNSYAIVQKYHIAVSIYRLRCHLERHSGSSIGLNLVTHRGLERSFVRKSPGISALGLPVLGLPVRGLPVQGTTANT